MPNDYYDTLDIDGDERPIADATARADISNKMDKLNPTGTGAMSINRADSTTVGNYSTAEGYAGTASGTASHAEGSLTQSTGTGSHAEGILTEATGDDSHAEGYSTEAAVDHSHAEGLETLAAGLAAHAEGWDTQASDDYSHAEGESTVASGEASHAEGLNCIASGDDSHAEGWSTEASGLHSHAEGVSTVAGGLGSHAEGEGTLASSNLQHVGGKYNTEDTQGDFAEIIGNGTADNARSNARTLDWQGNERLSGGLTINAGTASETDIGTAISGKMDADNPTGSGSFSMNRRSGSSIGIYSHAEGSGCIASGSESHAEGVQCIASGLSAHAEGYLTQATGNGSHSEGEETIASGTYSHAEGFQTKARGDNQHVFGQSNIEDTNNQYAEIVGNGDGVPNSPRERHNARTLDWQGNETIEGDLFFNGGASGLTAQLSGKQDALTAGNNVQISGSTISATDTKPDSYYANDSFADVTAMATGGTWKEVGQFQISKGTWIILAAIQYPSNATGMRSVGLYIDSSTTQATDVTGIVYQQTHRAADGGATNLVLTQLVQVPDSRYIHIMGRQTSGSSMGTTTNPIRIRARAIRILP